MLFHINIKICDSVNSADIQLLVMVLQYSAGTKEHSKA